MRSRSWNGFRHRATLDPLGAKVNGFDNLFVPTGENGAL